MAEETTVECRTQAGTRRKHCSEGSGAEVHTDIMGHLRLVPNLKDGTMIRGRLHRAAWRMSLHQLRGGRAAMQDSSRALMFKTQKWPRD